MKLTPGVKINFVVVLEFGSLICHKDKDWDSQPVLLWSKNVVLECVPRIGKVAINKIVVHQCGLRGALNIL